jgi:glutaredoxin
MKMAHGMTYGRALALALSFICLLGSCVLSACQSNERGEQTRASKKVTPPQLIKVSDSKKNLLFLYQDERGEEQTVMMLNQIPEAARSKVQVVDLTLSPEERRSRQFIQLFDLRQSGQGGQYPGRVIKRDKLERALASEQALPEQKPIILYSTNWCGVCKKARRFMEEKGLAFVEKDIESDRSAARELQEKCERAKVPLGGVPIIDVGGQLMRGFDPKRLLSMLESK